MIWAAIFLFFLIVIARHLQKRRSRINIAYSLDEDFAIWAFGAETWHKYMVLERDTIDLMNAWNEGHADKLRLNPDELIFKSMNEMKHIYTLNKPPTKPKEPQ